MIRLFDEPERTPEARLTCQWGALASIVESIVSGASTAGTAVANAAGTVGTGIANAAGTVGTGLEHAATGAGHFLGNAAGEVGEFTGVPSLYRAAETGLQNLGGEAGYLESLGQQVPQGVELAGKIPGLTDTGPGFFRGAAQGVSGMLGQYAEPSAMTQFGQGLGMLGNFVDTLRNPTGALASHLLRSALEQYGLEDRRGVRIGPAPLSGAAPAGLLHVQLNPTGGS